MSTNNNSKEFVNYWLYGTATEINWFDKTCQIAWNYLKGGCSIIPVANNSYDASGEELVVAANNKPNYLVLGLGRLLIGCAIFANIYYNLDILKAEYTYIDLHLQSILCMFDYPGFMVKRRSVMPLVPGFKFRVKHFWKFYTDPGDDRLGLVHLASYTLSHESFWFQFNSLLPAWSLSSYLTLIIVPGLDWPFSYDHFYYITLYHVL